MQWLANVCVRRPVFATVIILTIVVVGFVGYKNLAVDRFPNVDLPIVTVVTTLPGASPQEVETELSDKIEEAINTLSGIDELRSISTEGVSQVIVSFQLDKDINIAAQEVREHVSTVQPDLPEGTKSPVIAKIDPDAAPVLFLALESSRPFREVTEFADHEVRQALENVSGVGQVTIIGGRKRQIQIDLDPARLRSAGLSAVDALMERVKEVTPTFPAGYTLRKIRDNTEATRTSVEAVKEHLGLGAVLASLVVLLFLGNLRSTLIAAVAIPTSIIGTFMCMW